MNSLDRLCNLLSGVSAVDRRWLLDQLSTDERVAVEDWLAARAREVESEPDSGLLARQLALEPTWLQRAVLATLEPALRDTLARRLFRGRSTFVLKAVANDHPRITARWRTLLREALADPELAAAAMSGDPGGRTVAPFERLINQFRRSRQ